LSWRSRSLVCSVIFRTQAGVSRRARGPGRAGRAPQGHGRRPGRNPAPRRPELAELRADRLLPARLDDLRSYDPLYPRTYVEFMAAANGLAGDTLSEHYNRNMLFAAERDRLSHPLFSLANVGWFALPPRWTSGRRAGVGRFGAHDEPRPESWLRAETVAAGSRAELSLLEHAPARIEARSRSGRRSSGPADGSGRSGQPGV